jgi:hypothetical protein
MLNQQLDRQLGRLAIIGIALLASGVAASLGVLVVRATNAEESVSGYAVGQNVDVPTAWFHSSAFTVLMFARSDCQGCIEAKLLFQAITTLTKTAPRIRAILATPSDSADPDVVSLARDIGIDEGAVVTIDPTAVRLRIVPTLVLVDRGGKIVAIHATGLTPELRARAGDIAQQFMSGALAALGRS